MIQNGNTKDFSLPASVQSMKDIPISGNVIPMTWFQTITFDNGKPDTNSIIILSDIVYWYRPTEVRDERTGAVMGYKKKFAEDLLKRSYSDLESQFGISKKQCQESLRRLEEQGIISRVFRTLDTPSGRQNNVMYIDLHPEQLRSYTQKNLYNHGSEPFSDPMEKTETPYGDQTPQVWNSSSIGMESKLHSYGDRSPHHIKDTNTTSDTTPNISLSSKDFAFESTGDERELSSQMLSIWNEMIPQKKIEVLSSFLKTQLETAYASHLNSSLEQWRVVCQNFKSSKFLMGEAEGVRIKPDLLWLLDHRKPHLHHVLNKVQYTFDDRVARSKPLTSSDVLREIMSSSDELDVKILKRDLLEASPLCYIGYLRHSQFVVNDLSVEILTTTTYAKEQIEQKDFEVLKDLVSQKYGKVLEVSVMKQQ